jgi:putative lipoic acid-binding regulatory protein
MADEEQKPIIEFPCSFPIKMMGRDQESFRKSAVEVVGRHAGELADNAIRTSMSRNGNFLSITITIEARSQEQLDNIYNDLCSHKEILVAL